MDRAAQIEQIVRPLRTAEYECDFHWRFIDQGLRELGNDYGGFDLNPDFQRGHVWNEAQQQHYIENVLRGVVSSAGLVLQFNCPNWKNFDYRGDLAPGIQCVDGLQRYTAVQRFLAGDVRPFSLSVDDLEDTQFSSRRYRFRVCVHSFETKAELLTHYLDLNRGGTPHSAEEILRVQRMLQEVQK